MSYFKKLSLATKLHNWLLVVDIDCQLQLFHLPDFKWWAPILIAIYCKWSCWNLCCDPICSKFLLYLPIELLNHLIRKPSFELCSFMWVCLRLYILSFWWVLNIQRDQTAVQLRGTSRVWQWRGYVHFSRKKVFHPRERRHVLEIIWIQSSHLSSSI